MENAIGKLEQIYSQLEADRLSALAEYNTIKEEAATLDPRYRHKAREVGGIFLKLAVDSSIGMAKILEPIVKNESTSSSVSSRKELLEILDGMIDEPAKTERKEEEYLEELA